MAVCCAGSFDNFLNIQIVLIILLQLAMCVLHGGLGLWWRSNYGEERYFLALTIEGQVKTTDMALRLHGSFHWV